MGQTNNREGSILIMMTLVMVMAAMYLTTALFDVRGTVDQERLFRTKKQMTYLQNAIIDYRINNPTVALANLTALTSKPGTMSSCALTYSDTYVTARDPKGWCGPYIDTSLFLTNNSSATAPFQVDAWGGTFQLSVSGASGAYSYRLQSFGEDLDNDSCANDGDVCGPVF